MTMKDAISKFINWKSSYTSRAFVVYPNTLKRFFQYTQKDIEDLELQDIMEFKLYLKKQYHLSDNSIAQSLIVIKNFLKFFREQGIGQVNPSQIRISKNFTIKSHTPLTYEDFSKIDSVLDEKNYHDLQKKCCHNILWWTGIRVAELCELNVAQVSDTNSTEIKTKKNNITRVIIWPEDTKRLIDKYLKIRLALNSEPALFTGTSNSSSSRITPRTIQRWIKEFCQRAEINKKLSPHSYRHGKGHYMKELGAQDIDIADQLGHVSLNSTRVYTKPSKDEAKRRFKKFLVRK